MTATEVKAVLQKRTSRRKNLLQTVETKSLNHPFFENHHNAGFWLNPKTVTIHPHIGYISFWVGNLNLSEIEETLTVFGMEFKEQHAEIEHCYHYVSKSSDFSLWVEPAKEKGFNFQLTNLNPEIGEF